MCSRLSAALVLEIIVDFAERPRQVKRNTHPGNLAVIECGCHVDRIVAASLGRLHGQFVVRNHAKVMWRPIHENRLADDLFQWQHAPVLRI